MSTYFSVTLWLGFTPAQWYHADHAKDVFEDTVWPLTSKAAWEDFLVIMPPIPSDAAQLAQWHASFILKLNTKFLNEIKTLTIHSKILTPTNPPLNFVAPYVVSGWRTGSGGLHEVSRDPVQYNDALGSHGWTFDYTGTYTGTGVICTGARWTQLQV